jgi:hypothetical protein
MDKIDPKIWSSFCEKDAKWLNFIKRCVNENIDPHKYKNFQWDDVADWYYNRLLSQKKTEEEKMIQEYGKILFPVTFSMTESDT